MAKPAQTRTLRICLILGLLILPIALIGLSLAHDATAENSRMREQAQPDFYTVTSLGQRGPSGKLKYVMVQAPGRRDIYISLNYSHAKIARVGDRIQARLAPAESEGATTGIPEDVVQASIWRWYAFPLASLLTSLGLMFYGLFQFLRQHGKR